MNKLKKITVLIPCHNEEKGIGKVIDGIPVVKLKKMGYKTEVIVINNNSTDRTEHIAKKRKVTVIHEEKKGKGCAIQAGFMHVSKDTKFVVMLDGDDTYKGKEIPRLIEPLENNFCDVIIGTRLGGKTRDGAFRTQNRMANWFYTFLVRHIYRANVTDVLSGYFAWKKEVVDLLLPHIHSRGFSIEIDMITKMVLLGKSIYSVPVTYDRREGESKIEALKDGIIILGVLFLNVIWKPNIKSSRRQILANAIKEPISTVLHSFKLINNYERKSKIL